MIRGITGIISELEETVAGILEQKPRAVVSVIGMNGTGKSYLGRHLRKNGLGRFPRKRIAVIDDGTMFVELFGIFTKTVKIPTEGMDELEPFYRVMPEGKTIIIYINATPARRITQADVVLKLHIDEGTRRARLSARYGEGSESFRKYFERPEITDPGIRYTYWIDAET
jgi:hypothetical protein